MSMQAEVKLKQFLASVSEELCFWTTMIETNPTSCKLLLILRFQQLQSEELVLAAPQIRCCLRGHWQPTREWKVDRWSASLFIADSGPEVGPLPSYCHNIIGPKTRGMRVWACVPLCMRPTVHVLIWVVALFFLLVVTVGCLFTCILNPHRSSSLAPLQPL